MGYLMKLPRLLQRNNSQGVISEKAALAFLEAKGLVLLNQNYFCRFGEIDLIMKEKDTLIFIEVRFRKNSFYGGAAGSINYSKQKKIINTAQHYLLTLPELPYCRFDVIAIENSTEITWIKNAFQE